MKFIMESTVCLLFFFVNAVLALVDLIYFKKSVFDHSSVNLGTGLLVCV